MSIMVRPQLVAAINEGRIVAPLSNVQENSINFRLGDDMWTDFKRKSEGYIDPYSERTWSRVEGRLGKDSDSDGEYFILHPGRVYLGTTDQAYGTRVVVGKRLIVPECRARSTTGRHGLTVAMCAGVGDFGYEGRWVLEIVNNNEQPIILRPGTEIGQFVFYESEHVATPEDAAKHYRGADRYQKSDGSIQFLPKPYEIPR